ncbi:hypothetical protein GCM10023191_049030 [Actinoallomurus oryzae]|uniref:Uncharacterized protein n=1 Tax=Actinoallomurus oryzae TaxID=502180 RepID=A0ABP8QB55_9ACTN
MRASADGGLDGSSLLFGVDPHRVAGRSPRRVIFGHPPFGVRGDVQARADLVPERVDDAAAFGVRRSVGGTSPMLEYSRTVLVVRPVRRAASPIEQSLVSPLMRPLSGFP